MLLKKLSKYSIYLGSQSPRRKQLLEGMGFHFGILPIRHSDENYPDSLKEHDIAIYLALQKMRLYNDFFTHSNIIIITADTIVSLEGKILGKPSNAAEAFNMLKQLSGKKHVVYTGVCLKTQEKETSFYDATDVYFKTLSDDEIQYYIDHYKPYDKAGSYGAQEWIGYVGIEKIEGSYFNVMGLPVHKLYVELENLIS